MALTLPSKRLRTYNVLYCALCVHAPTSQVPWDGVRLPDLFPWVRRVSCFGGGLKALGRGSAVRQGSSQGPLGSRAMRSQLRSSVAIPGIDTNFFLPSRCVVMTRPVSPNKSRRNRRSSRSRVDDENATGPKSVHSSLLRHRHPDRVRTGTTGDEYALLWSLYTSHVWLLHSNKGHTGREYMHTVRYVVGGTVSGNIYQSRMGSADNPSYGR